MCRFLMIQANSQFKPTDFLTDFAERCKESTEWQGDGWGVCWLSSKCQWQSYKSLKPIWEETAEFSKIPDSKTFLVHARSSSFEAHKGRIEFNQPFIRDQLAFVFNGLIKSVSGLRVQGEIGSQKVFNLICDFYQKGHTLEASIEGVKNLIKEKSKEITALNLGLCDKERLYALNYFSSQEDYYTLFHFNSSIKIISSVQLSKVSLVPLKKDHLVVL